MKKINSQRIWVYPDFAKKLKVKAAENGLPIYKYTKELCYFDNIEDSFKNGKKNFKI